MPSGNPEKIEGELELEELAAEIRLSKSESSWRQAHLRERSRIESIVQGGNSHSGWESGRGKPATSSVPGRVNPGHSGGLEQPGKRKQVRHEDRSCTHDCGFFDACTDSALAITLVPGKNPNPVCVLQRIE